MTVRPALSASTHPARWRSRVIDWIDRHGDRVGTVAAFLILIAVAALPFVTVRANRIVSGKSLGLFAVMPRSLAMATAVLIIASAIFAAYRPRQRPAQQITQPPTQPPAHVLPPPTPPHAGHDAPQPESDMAAVLADRRERRAQWLRFAGGVGCLCVMALLIAGAPARLVDAGDAFARVSPASGAYVLALAYGILVTDAVAKLAIPAASRLLGLLAAVAAVLLCAHWGWWDGLSIMKEYASHAASFREEALRHLVLVFASVGAATIAGLPLGIAAARHAIIRAIVLPVLNMVQTIPSIALYGLLMVPLGLLAARSPLAASLGIQGIGFTPALVALFLYSLLPIASNVMVGLQHVPGDMVEAATGMGMTARQRLLQLELPLALPVILSGIRIVLIQNIGLTAVAALIGGGGFGTFIFQGIGQSASDLVLLGTIPTVVLALIAGVAFEALRNRVDPRR